MPTYQYRCTECGHELEAVQKFTDPSLTVCPACEGALNKVFSPVGIVFKGSGFYATDSRRKSSASQPAASSDSRAETPAAEVKPAPTASEAAKPAAAKASTPTSSAA